MPSLTQIRIEKSEKAERLNALAAKPAGTQTPDEAEEQRRLESDLGELEVSYRAALKEQDERRINADDGEGREIRNLERPENQLVATHLRAAASGNQITGAAAEHAEALNAPGQFPLRLLHLGKTEHRATTDVDTQVNARDFLARVFPEEIMASRHLGVQYDSVPAGVATYPAVTAGITPKMRAKGEAATDDAWSVTTQNLEPHRLAGHFTLATTDIHRLPSISEALIRDARASLANEIDKAVLVGNDTATGTDDDIIGIQGSAATGLSDATLSQSNKVKPLQILNAFLASRDGRYASRLSDLKVVASTATANLWAGTFANSDADSMTIEQWLRQNGVTYRVRAEIEDSATTAGKFAALIGKGIGIESAAICAVWDAGTLVRDMYSAAPSGTIKITLEAQIAFSVIRGASFARIKYS